MKAEFLKDARFYLGLVYITAGVSLLLTKGTPFGVILAILGLIEWHITSHVQDSVTEKMKAWFKYQYVRIYEKDKGSNCKG